MPYARLADETRLYYEFLGPEDGPTILQFGGGLFGRHNFGAVNEGFQEAGFRLLAFDARGYGASDHPHEQFTIEGWADDGAALLDALGLDRVLVHGTSMGGMIAIAFAAKHGERTIAACADVAFAKPDVYRKTLFRVWRRMAESMPWDDFSDHVTTQAVGPRFLESEEGAGHVRARPHRDRLERPVHRAPGMHRHGGDGPDAARAADLRPAADDQRHATTSSAHPSLHRPASARGRWRP